MPKFKTLAASWRRPGPAFAFVLTILAAWMVCGHAAFAVDVSGAVAWYDTLGHPDAKDLPYVRVATGLWMKSGALPPENRFVEGFLIGEEADAFTVFLCSVPDFKDPYRHYSEPYAPLTTVRFVRQNAGPAHKLVAFEVLDFKKAASEALDRVRGRTTTTVRSLQGGFPVFYRMRIFSFARACLQKGLSETAAELMGVVANIPDEQTGKKNPQMLREALQQQIGDAILLKAEKDAGNPLIPWAELLKVYDNFDVRFPASSKVGYAREAADALRRMIAADAKHHPKPLKEMSLTEQAAEYIYQLRNLKMNYWILNSRYPVDEHMGPGNEMVTPVLRLVDLGSAAVPQLIEALNDKGFTRSMEPRFNGVAPPRVMRVADAAQKILEHISARNFHQGRTDNGKPSGGTTLQLAKAWWAEMQGKGEKQQLIDATAAGGETGCNAARKLVEKYPDAALEAIKAGIRATTSKALRGEYVEIAGALPGDAAAAFLKDQLGADKGVYSQVHAAEALSSRGQSNALPAMIEAWRAIQPRLPADEGDAYSEVGKLITFLANSGDAKAIEALAAEAPKAPIDVRLAVVEVFLPFGNDNGSSVGRSVAVDSDPDLPKGKVGAPAERLLVSALDDTERRIGMERDFDHFACLDPRVCDMAAFTLSKLWPDKYRFRWAFTSTQCDLEIAGLRNRWRSDNGLPVLQPPSRVVIPVAKESDVAPLLDKFAAASDDAGRDAMTAQIAEAFGLSALPAVRARFEETKNAAFRKLTLSLASRVREVKIEADANGSAAKSGIAALKGQALNGARLAKLAQDLEAGLPAGVRSVTVFVERAGDGTGFQVNVRWIPGVVKKQHGWNRPMAVRHGNQRLCDSNGWYSGNGIAADGVYREMADAFEKALQADIDSPVLARFQIQRGGDSLDPSE